MRLEYIMLSPLNQTVLHLDWCYFPWTNLLKERGGCNILPGFIFVQSLQMKRWISSTVWTTVARQPPTLTTLPRRAPLAPPTLPPTHTCTHTLTRINTLPLCQPPARTRLPKHTGPTGTHTLPFCPTTPSISSIHHHPFNVPSALSFLFFLFLQSLFLHYWGQRDLMTCSSSSLFLILVHFMFMGFAISFFHIISLA